MIGSRGRPTTKAGRVKRTKNRVYYRAHADELKAKRRARYRAKVLGGPPC